MAATRVRGLGVHEVAARLDDRFRLLAAGRRGAPPRQRTLRATIDWSWALLDEPERILLRRLAVHTDGCTLAAAEEVCAGKGVESARVVDLLSRLVDCSLVVFTDTVTTARYRLLESVAAYCLDRLDEAGELAHYQRRHREYYTAFAERAEQHLRGHNQRQWLQRLDAETANLRSAFETAVRHGEADLALRLANAMSWYWFLRGRLAEARRSLLTALEMPGPAPVVRRAMATAWQIGIGLVLRGGADPEQEYRTALEPFDQVDDLRSRAMAEWFLGSTMYGIGDLSPSEQLVDRALGRFEALGDRWGVAAALSSRSFQAKLRGTFTTLKRDGERSLALFREIGDHWGQLQAIGPLATYAEVVGDYDVAARLYRDGLRLAEEFGLWPSVSLQLAGLGRIALLTGDYQQAREFHQRARRLSIEQSDRFGEQFAEIGLALGARREGRLDAAGMHLDRVLELHREIGYAPETPALVSAEFGFIAELRGDADGALAAHRTGLDTATESGDPRAVALALEGLAGAYVLAGYAEHGARLLGAAAEARESAGAPLPGGERGDVERISARARTELGEDGFVAAFKHGGELRPDEYLVID
jgi:tetratricopeptide (TPR) repeat protein